jgi:hypothetical protein
VDKQRKRLLPARVVVYFVLALALFYGDSYEEVMRKLAQGLSWLAIWKRNGHVPTSSALAQAQWPCVKNPQPSTSAARFYVGAGRELSVGAKATPLPPDRGNDPKGSRRGVSFMPARLCTAKVDLRKQVEEAYRYYSPGLLHDVPPFFRFRTVARAVSSNQMSRAAVRP